MNIIKAIEDIHKKLDYIISTQKGEKMLDPSTLEAELSRATGLLTKSKDYIYYLSNKIMGVEANLASHAAILANNVTVEAAVSNVASGFSEAFSDFEDFLGTFMNNDGVDAANNAPIANGDMYAPVVPVSNPIVNFVNTIENDVVNVVHNIDPRLFHTNPPVGTPSN